jgi:outer membrane immunogenic protein
LEIEMKTLMRPAMALLLGGAMAFPAVAGSLDAPASEPVVAAPVVPYVASNDWTGGYVGAQIGYGDFSAGAVEGDGAIYGLRAGYDWDFGQWVAGVGVDWDKADIDLGAGPDAIDSVARLKLRAGYDLGQTLIYATAGGARAKADIGGISRSDNGYFGGIGVEYALTDQWSVGGEILEHRFDNFDNLGVDVDATTASLNVNFRF